MQQTVPFSFESLYAIGHITRDEDYRGEPFDLTRWAVVERGGTAEVRYRLHTRSVELHPLLKRLSKEVPLLTFALVTQCMDDGDFAPFTIRGGRMRGGWLGDEWREPFWERAATAFNMPVDETWEDPETEAIAERWMRDAALQIAMGSDRVYGWSGGPLYRDLEDERANVMLEFARALKTVDEEERKPARSSRRKRRRPQKR